VRNNHGGRRKAEGGRPRGASRAVSAPAGIARRLGAALAVRCAWGLPVLSARAGAAALPPHAWPQWGGSPARNNVAEAKGLPTRWDIGKIDNRSGQWQGSPDKQIRWVAKLGSESYGTPIVAGGKVFCAANNAGYLARYPAKADLGCLVCFSASDGRFLWQLAREKLSAGRSVDWPQQGICSTPLVQGDRLWIVTNRAEVLCLDTEGFEDDENDGPVTDEPRADRGEADIVWSFDMMRELGIVQRYMCSCSPPAAGDLVLVGTANGVDLDDRIPAPKAPSFIALDKRTGKLVWADASPGQNILEGQWSSPASAVLGGSPQAIFAGGDGWLYGFQADRVEGGRPLRLWAFDCNPKDAVWEGGGGGRRNQIIATPVVADGRVFIGTGQDPEAGEGPGDLWCVDPAKRGDVSPELVLDSSGKPVPPRRLQAVDADAGDRVAPNPSSAAVWHYTGQDSNGDGKLDFPEVMHRTLGSPAVKDGLLVIGDFAGLIHCLEARTGKRLWAHDAMAAVWGSPLVADGKVYLGTEDGDMLVFEFGRQFKLLAKNDMGGSVYGTPVVVDNVLYISTRSHLFAIGGEQGRKGDKSHFQ